VNTLKSEKEELEAKLAKIEENSRGEVTQL